MKKIGVVLLSILTFFTNTSFVLAACETAEMNELNSLAVKVKTSYDVIEKEIPSSEGISAPDGMTEEEIENYVPKDKYFKIYIDNITEDLYVTVGTGNSKDVKTYTYNDSENGTITFEEKESIHITNYTITIYSSEKTGCPNTKLHTLNLTTPMYNPFSESYLCNGIEEFYLCHEYLSVKTSFTGFSDLTTKYREGKLNQDGTDKKEEETKKEGFIEYIKEHKGVVITVCIVIIAIGGLVTVIIVKKQRSRIV